MKERENLRERKLKERVALEKFENFRDETFGQKIFLSL